MSNIEKKMRIQLYDEDFNMMGDRLVVQSTEFAKGPIDTHTGPMRIEFSLFDKGDIEACSNYLKQLEGALPLETPKKPRGRKKLNVDTPNARAEFLESLDKLEDPDQLIELLREEGFVFTTLEYLQDLGNPIAIKKVHRKNYDWLVKLTRKAKNPLNHRYDISILVGFKEDKVIIYSENEVHSKRTFDKAIESKIKIPIKFKVKFPHYMQHEERSQFRVQVELLKEDLELKPSRLYLRWLSDVMRSSPKSIEFPRAGEIKDTYEKNTTVAELQIQLFDDPDANDK